MKKLFSMLTLGLILMATAIVSNAATLTREYAPSGGSGTSQASICTNQTCTGLTNMGFGSSISKFGDADGITVTFDYAFYPGSPSTISIGPSQIATINASPGTYFTFAAPGGCDFVKIKLSSPGNYVYHVYTICL